MHQALKCAIVGSLAVAGVVAATADVQAMTIQSLSPAASTTSVEKVWWRGGYGGYGGYGYGWRRPYYGYGYGWRRPYYGYGYGYGWRRPHYVWRRW